MWYNQRLWGEEEMREFLAANELSTDELDSLMCRLIASALKLLNEKEVTLQASRRAVEIRDSSISNKVKRIKELEDFLNETQARIRGALRTEKP